MSADKEMTCIECPRGCRLAVSVTDGVASVAGNACPKGAVWGAQEALAPMRTLTTTVQVRGSARRRLPVRTDGELPLSRLLDAMAAIDPVTVRPPLRRGDVVVRDLLGLGVDLVATDDLPGDPPGDLPPGDLPGDPPGDLPPDDLLPDDLLPGGQAASPPRSPGAPV